MQFYGDVKTPYMEAQVIQKAHHVVLAYGIFVDACKEWSKNPSVEQKWIRFFLNNIQVPRPQAQS